MTQFSDLGLDPLLLKALDTEGYTTPTPIQAQAIPSILAGKDLLGIAQTGTGKTAAFALPILQRLAADKRQLMRRGVRALILSPTRELATQIGESFRTYGRHMNLSVAVVFGGVAHRPQRQALDRGVDVVVATPGRLIDHMTEGNVVLDGTEILVLDEADQMMDLGFIRPLRQIVSKLSQRRQSLFFSATMPHEIGALAAELLRDPVKVSVTPVAKTADRVEQKVIFVEQTRKRALLAELFANPELARAIVFTRTKRGADRVAKYLEGAGVAVAAIHGNKSQAQRDHAMAGFKAGRIRALIATDIAARGIDVDAVSHVVNYEIPNVPESYVHRIGRTARAGAEGIAISLVDNEERGYLRDIERLTRLPIPAEDRRGDATLVVPTDREEPADRPDRRAGGGRGERPHQDRGGRGGRGGDRGGDRGGERSFRGERSSSRPQGSRDHAPRTEAPRAEGRSYDPLQARTDAARAERTDARRDSRPGEGRSNDARPAHRGGSWGDKPRGDRPRGDRSDARPAHRSGEGRSERPRGEGRPAYRSEPRGDHPRGDRSDARPAHRSGEGRSERPRGEGRGEPRRDHRAGEGRPEHRADRPHGERGEQRREHRAGEGRPEGRRFERDGARHGGDKRPHGERSHTHARQARGNGGATAQQPRGERGQGQGARPDAPAGLEKVRFLNDRSGPRRSSGGPRANDRQKARREPA